MTGQDIITIREARGLSRAQLGKVIGKSYRSILRWEQTPGDDIAADTPTIIVLELLRDGLLPDRYLGDAA